MDESHIDVGGFKRATNHFIGAQVQRFEILFPFAGAQHGNEPGVLGFVAAYVLQQGAIGAVGKALFAENQADGMVSEGLARLGKVGRAESGYRKVLQDPEQRFAIFWTARNDQYLQLGMHLPLAFANLARYRDALGCFCEARWTANLTSTI